MFSFSAFFPQRKTRKLKLCIAENKVNITFPCSIKRGPDMISRTAVSDPLAEGTGWRIFAWGIPSRWVDLQSRGGILRCAGGRHSAQTHY
jgi:hypothetical protein